MYKFNDLMINYTFLFRYLNKQLLMNAFSLTVNTTTGIQTFQIMIKRNIQNVGLIDMKISLM